MSDKYDLLDEHDKKALVGLADELIRYADFCVIYEDDNWSDDSEEKQRQLFDYLTREIYASRVGNR